MRRSRSPSPQPRPPGIDRGRVPSPDRVPLIPVDSSNHTFETVRGVSTARVYDTVHLKSCYIAYSHHQQGMSPTQWLLLCNEAQLVAPRGEISEWIVTHLAYRANPRSSSFMMQHVMVTCYTFTNALKSHACLDANFVAQACFQVGRVACFFGVCITLGSKLVCVASHLPEV